MVKRIFIGTKLVFIPEVGRDPKAPLSLQKKTYIVHGNVFEANPRSICSFGREVHQSARGPLPIVTGWGGCEFVPEEEMEGQLAREIISFANNGEAAGAVGDYEMPGLPRTSGGTPTLVSMRQFMSISNPTNPLHLLVTIHIHRRERARTKAEGKGKYQGGSYGKSSHREGRPMESVEAIAKARLSGRGAIPILGFGMPKEVGSGSGIEDQLIPCDYGCLRLCLACAVCCVHTLNVEDVWISFGEKFF